MSIFSNTAQSQYVYFAMAFSVGVEYLNLRVRAKRAIQPIHLRKALREDVAPSA